MTSSILHIKIQNLLYAFPGSFIIPVYGFSYISLIFSIFSVFPYEYSTVQ